MDDVAHKQDHELSVLGQTMRHGQRRILEPTQTETYFL